MRAIRVLFCVFCLGVPSCFGWGYESPYGSLYGSGMGYTGYVGVTGGMYSSCGVGYGVGYGYPVRVLVIRDAADPLFPSSRPGSLFYYGGGW